MNYQDKVVLITGGSSGIGLATGRQFAKRGAHVWLLARDRQRLQAALADVASEVAHPGQRYGIVVGDVTDPEQVEGAVAEVSASIGLPDIIVNSAGITYPGYFQDLDLTVFRDVMEINYFGTLHMVKALIPGMIARRSEHIVNISSVAGFLGVFGYSTYGPSKYAVRGLSDVLRVELKPYHIGVSVVYPPDTDTPQLAYENGFKPSETRALAGGNVLSADAVAKAIVDGIARRRYTITPGLEASLFYGLAGLLGDWQFRIMDALIAKAQRNIRKRT